MKQNIFGFKRFAVSILVIVFFIILLTSGVLNKAFYSFAMHHVNLNDENLAFLDYKVYGSIEVFNRKSPEYIENKVKFLKDNNEIAVVKIKGAYQKTINSDYVLVFDEKVPELNVEIYVAKNIDIFNNSLPAKTVFVNGIRIINNVAAMVGLSVSEVCFLICFYAFLIKRHRFKLKANSALTQSFKKNY